MPNIISCSFFFNKQRKKPDFYFLITSQTKRTRMFHLKNHEAFNFPLMKVHCHQDL
jgi:hypothetical protein